VVIAEGGVGLAVIAVAAVIVLTLGTALFVAAEFSLVAADRAELEDAARAETGRRSGC
jgi:CBS domain containing-hemolysin-like protein